MKTYYLIAHYCHADGRTFNDPNYYLGTYNNIIFNLDKRTISPRVCYQRYDQALRQAAKLCTGTWSARVIEIPIDDDIVAVYLAEKRAERAQAKEWMRRYEAENAARFNLNRFDEA